MEKQIAVESLEILSKNWDNRTIKILVCESRGNMFGGQGEGVVVTVHGENSISQTGKIELVGRVTFSYNISRGVNGPKSETLTYTPINGSDPITINIVGSCGGAKEALCAILGCQKDYLK